MADRWVQLGQPTYDWLAQFGFGREAVEQLVKEMWQEALDCDEKPAGCGGGAQRWLTVTKDGKLLEGHFVVYLSEHDPYREGEGRFAGPWEKR